MADLRERNRQRKLERAAEERAFDELERRGRDPRIQRRFRGRVSLQVRCAKGHGLADVYPTREGLVFVPWAELTRRADQMPTSADRRRRRAGVEDQLRLSQREEAGHESDAEIAEIAPIFEALWRIPRDQQPFSKDWMDDDGKPVNKPTGGEFVILRGIELLSPRRLAEWSTAEYESVGWRLLCRCGPRSLFCGELANLIERGAAKHYI